MPLDDGTIALAVTKVTEDVERCFGEVLTAVEPVRIGFEGFSDMQAVTVSDLFVTVPWSYLCVHSGRFLEIDPTFVQLDLRGTTSVQISDDSDEWQYHRFVDFLGALHQMGVTTTTRPTLTPTDYETWKSNISA